MNIAQKLAYAKQAVTSIIDHDDAPMEAVGMAVDQLKEHMDAKMVEAQARRMAAAGMVVNGK